MAIPEAKPLANPFTSLPYDLLHAVIAHIPDAASLSSLTRTCKALHQFIATSGHGWQIFVQSQFPSIYATLAPQDPDDNSITIDWRRHAQELTLLSRNYDRRAFLAHVLDPDVLVPNPHYHAPSRFSRTRGRIAQYYRWGFAPGKGRQSVGYHPVIDARASGGGSGGELLAVGAGQDLLVRRRNGKQIHWWVYEDCANVAGRDDITALKMFSDYEGDGNSERVLVGRANGALSVVKLQTARQGAGGVAGAQAEMALETRGAKVRSASLMGGLVASVLGNDIVAVHQLPEFTRDRVHVRISGELALWSPQEQPWTVHLLSGSVLAVGKSSAESLAVYSITPTGLTTVRAFGADECVGSKVSSVHPIASLPDIMGSPNVFIAGWYTGATLIHDLRTPLSHTAAFIDPLDPTSKVYSLLPIGRERVIVGGGRHSLLKVFDIRMPGGRVYYSPTSSLLESIDPDVTSGWATYLSRDRVGFGLGQRQRGLDRESPVYSLVAGGSGGASVFAGVEGCVWEFDFLGENLKGDRRDRRECVMYEFIGRTRLWRQGREELMGAVGESGSCGVLDGRWR